MSFMQRCYNMHFSLTCDYPKPQAKIWEPALEPKSSDFKPYLHSSCATLTWYEKTDRLMLNYQPKYSPNGLSGGKSRQMNKMKENGSIRKNNALTLWHLHK